MGIEIVVLDRASRLSGLATDLHQACSHGIGVVALNGAYNKLCSTLLDQALLAILQEKSIGAVPRPLVQRSLYQLPFPMML